MSRRAELRAEIEQALAKEHQEKADGMAARERARQVNVLLRAARKGTYEDALTALR